MKASEHLARAEQLLEDLSGAEKTDDRLSLVEMGLEAIGHALAAIGIEMGVPVTGTPAPERTSA